MAHGIKVWVDKVLLRSLTAVQENAYVISSFRFESVQPIIVSSRFFPVTWLWNLDWICDKRPYISERLGIDELLKWRLIQITQFMDDAFSSQGWCSDALRSYLFHSQGLQQHCWNWEPLRRSSRSRRAFIENKRKGRTFHGEVCKQGKILRMYEYLSMVRGCCHVWFEFVKRKS